MPLDEMVSRYITGANQAAAALFEQQLYGFFLVIVYSTIDTFGLLNAPAGQTEASGDSFRAWAAKYLVPRATDPYTADDLWGARCGVLHTFSTDSRWAKQGKARQLQYYLGTSPAARHFVEVTRLVEGGAHLAVHLANLGQSFFHASMAFAPDLSEACRTSEWHERRVRDVLQIYPMQ
ncbi:hypothetical protein [Cognatilysobacter segetis]|uniref:hypothetical protein n=1 Tax=Cognatilysobacter segetis TaxID=2492394 RepID=UPI00105F01F3|nr:hypothetical protein [Lysobacter segetis]